MNKLNLLLPISPADGRLFLVESTTSEKHYGNLRQPAAYVFTVAPFQLSIPCL